MTRFAPEGYEIPLRYAIRAGDWVVASGQVGHVDFTLVEGGFEAECRQALENLRNALQAAGTDLDHVVKGNVYLADIRDFDGMNEIWVEYFSSPFPARTAMAVADLPFGARVEIEAWAYHP